MDNLPKANLTMKLRNAPLKKNIRRIKALERLQAEIAATSGVTHNSDLLEVARLQRLDRMQEEAKILQSRITSPEAAVMRKMKKYRGAK